MIKVIGATFNQSESKDYYGVLYGGHELMQLAWTLQELGEIGSNGVTSYRGCNLLVFKANDISSLVFSKYIFYFYWFCLVWY